MLRGLMNLNFKKIINANFYHRRCQTQFHEDCPDH